MMHFNCTCSGIQRSDNLLVLLHVYIWYNETMSTIATLKDLALLVV